MSYETQTNCIIYCICNTDDEWDENTYIGSTIDTFNRRIARHKHDYTQGSNRELYKYIRDHGGWDCFTFVILEQRLISSHREKLAAEQEYIDIEEPTLNTIDALLTKEKMKQKKKEYAEKNKEHLKQKSRECRARNKTHLDAYHKTWVENNKESLKAYKKAHYEANKAKQQEVVICECGRSVKKYSMRPHLKSKRHLKLLNIKKTSLV